MSTLSTILSLIKHADGDNARTALSTNQPSNMDILDALFHTTSGHTHSGAGTNGTKIPYASISAVAWTDWTPALTQGSAVAHTKTYARYCVIGKIAHVQVRLASTAAGTGGQVIVMGDIPAAIQPLRASGGADIAGTFLYFDTGTGYYQGAVIAVTGTTFQMFRDGESTYFGTAITLANGDEIGINCVYEIA